MAPRNCQVFVDEWVIIVQLQWVWGATEPDTGAHITYGLADDNFEQSG